MRRPLMWLVGCLGVCLVLLAACGAPSAPKPPGGTYSSSEFHFQVNYPQGWQTNVAPDASSTIPLTVIITRTSGEQIASHVSTFTIAVISLKELAAIDKKPVDKVVDLAHDKTLTKTQIGGLTAYSAAPVKQQIPGATVSITHTDYYMVNGGYEYQISTDSIDGDGADPALQSMLQSFKFSS